MNKLWTDEPINLSFKPIIKLSTVGFRHGPKHLMKFLICQWIIFGAFILVWFEFFGVPTLESIKSVGPSNLLKIVRGQRSDQNFEMLFESQKKIKWISSIDTPIENFINTDPKISYIYHMNASLGDAFSHSLSALFQSLENSQDDNVKNAVLLSISKSDLVKVKQILSLRKNSMKGKVKMLMQYFLPNVLNSSSVNELHEYKDILPNFDGLLLSLKTSKADELNWNAVYYIRKFMNEVKDVWNIGHFLFEIHPQFEHKLIESIEALLSINWFHRVTNTLFILPSYSRKSDLSEFLSNDRLIFKEEKRHLFRGKENRNLEYLNKKMEIFKMDFKNVNVNFGEALKWKSDYCVILHKSRIDLSYSGAKYPVFNFTLIVLNRLSKADEALLMVKFSRDIRMEISAFGKITIIDRKADDETVLWLPGREDNKLYSERYFVRTRNIEKFYMVQIFKEDRPNAIPLQSFEIREERSFDGRITLENDILSQPVVLCGLRVFVVS